MPRQPTEDEIKQKIFWFYFRIGTPKFHFMTEHFELPKFHFRIEHFGPLSLKFHFRITNFGPLKFNFRIEKC